MTFSPFLVYVAGPYTADTKEQVEQNVSNAIMVGDMVNNLAPNVWAVVPHLLHHHYVHPETRNGDYKYYIDWSAAWLGGCRAMLVIKRSRGVDMEIDYCHAHGIPIFWSVSALAEWVSGLYLGDGKQYGK